MTEPREVPSPEVLAEMVDEVIAKGVIKRSISMTLPDGRVIRRVESVSPEQASRQDVRQAIVEEILRLIRGGEVRDEILLDIPDLEAPAGTERN